MQSVGFASDVNGDEESKSLDCYTELCLPAAPGSLKVAEEVTPLELHLPPPPPPPPKSRQTYAKPPQPLQGDVKFASNVSGDDESKNLDCYTEPCLPAAPGSLKVAKEVTPLELHLPPPPPPPPKSLKTYAKPPPPLQGDVNATSKGAAIAPIGASRPTMPSYPPPPPPPQRINAERWDKDLARWVPHFFEELEGDLSDAKLPWHEMCDAKQNASASRAMQGDRGDWPSADSAGSAVVPSAVRNRRNKIPTEHSESDMSKECESMESLSSAPSPSRGGGALTTQLWLDVGSLLDGQWWDRCGLVGTVKGHVFRLAHHEASDVYDIKIDPKHLKVNMCLLGENMDGELVKDGTVLSWSNGDLWYRTRM